MTEIQEKHDLNYFLQKILPLFIKKDYKEKIKPEKYSMKCYFQRGPVEELFASGVYNDAGVIFVLFTKCAWWKNYQEPIAWISFDEIKDENAIIIRQIQGARGKQGILQFFRWEKLLVNIILDWAKEKEYKKIRIIKANQSTWYKRENIIISYAQETHQKNMLLRYDKTAQRMGFKLNESIDQYELAL